MQSKDSGSEERLNKFLARLGYGSRRKIDVLIQGGNVVVNGRKAVLGQKITPADKILLNGKSIISQEVVPIIIALNKPKGIVSTVDDEFGRKSVVDLVTTEKRLFPVGRLDKETVGLILLTNDGDLAFRLTHPKYEVEKEYEVELTKPLIKEQLYEITTGIQDGRETYVIDKIDSIGKMKYKIVLHEGKKREIRRIMSLLGANILELKRVRIGKINLGELKSGEFREVLKNEIENLT